MVLAASNLPRQHCFWPQQAAVLSENAPKTHHTLPPKNKRTKSEPIDGGCVVFFKMGARYFLQEVEGHIMEVNSNSSDGKKT